MTVDAVMDAVGNLAKDLAGADGIPVPAVDHAAQRDCIRVQGGQLFPTAQVFAEQDVPAAGQLEVMDLPAPLAAKSSSGEG